MKKNFILILVFLCISYFCFIAFADGDSYGTDVEYIANGEESYLIEVPAKLSPGESGNVRVYGAWPSNKTISVGCDNSVTLVNTLNSSETKNLEIEFNDIYLSGSNVSWVEKIESISVSDMPENVLFGNWKGRFNYSVTFLGDSTSFKFGEKYALTYINDILRTSNDVFPDYVVINADGSGYTSAFYEPVVLDEYEVGEMLITSNYSLIYEDDNERQYLSVSEDGNVVEMIMVDAYSCQSYVLMRFVRIDSFNTASPGSHTKGARYIRFNDDGDLQYVIFGTDGVTSLKDTMGDDIFGPFNYIIVDKTVFFNDGEQNNYLVFGQLSDDGTVFNMYNTFSVGRSILYTFTLE